MENIVERDRSLIWHPCTQELITPPPILIKSAQGSYLMDENGNLYLDLISSWWVNIHGHAQPQITEAIYEQCKTLEHVIFARFTHEPAVTYCNNLSSLLPHQLCKFFFSDNGSTCVEVALKMAYKFWKNKGVEKKNFLSFEGSYHGETFGSMSVGMVSQFHTDYRPLCFHAQFIPFPDTWPGDIDVDEKEQKAMDVMVAHLKVLGDSVAALIIEPLIQCAGGMMMCRQSFMKAVCQLAKEHDIFVIFDEVATGFGRTGTTFAYEQVDVVPDFLCVAKGITGGFLPLAMTVTTQRVYEAFLGQTIGEAFLHSHSYTANPVGCAAAIASLKLLQKEETKQAIQNINQIHVEEVAKLMKNYKYVKHGRVLGTIAAFELELENLEPFIQYCMSNKIILRPLGKTIYMMPPYCILSEELKNAYKIIFEAVELFTETIQASFL